MLGETLVVRLPEDSFNPNGQAEVSEVGNRIFQQPALKVEFELYMRLGPGEP